MGKLAVTLLALAALLATVRCGNNDCDATVGPRACKLTCADDINSGEQQCVDGRWQCARGIVETSCPDGFNRAIDTIPQPDADAGAPDVDAAGCDPNAPGRNCACLQWACGDHVGVNKVCVAGQWVCEGGRVDECTCPPDSGSGIEDGGA